MRYQTKLIGGRKVVEDTTRRRNVSTAMFEGIIKKDLEKHEGYKAEIEAIKELEAEAVEFNAKADEADQEKQAKEQAKFEAEAKKQSDQAAVTAKAKAKAESERLEKAKSNNGKVK